MSLTAVSLNATPFDKKTLKIVPHLELLERGIHPKEVEDCRPNKPRGDLFGSNKWHVS
jgi:hypothetical protein